MEILFVVLTVIGTYIFSSFCFQYEMSDRNYQFQLKDCLHKNIYNIIMFIQIIVISIFGSIMFYFQGYSFISLYKYIILISLVFLSALIDAKKQIIPNLIVLVLLVVVILFDLYQVVLNIDNAMVFSLSFLLGGCIAFIIFFISMLISRGGIGAGDVKLLTVIGLSVGIATILDILFYILLSCFIFSIVMLILRKVKLKDSIPMAPFIYIGLVIYFVISLM